MSKRGFNGALMRAFGAHDHIATVTATERVAPDFLRVHFDCASVFSELDVTPAAFLRFWFPDPEGSDKEFQRAYTLSSSDPERGTFSCDFVLHTPAGPASAWASSAQAGDQVPVAVLGASRFSVPDDLPAGYLLIGDAAAIPAINSVIAALPDDVPIELYLEEHRTSDRQIPLATHPRLHVHWVERAGAPSLAAAIEARDWSNWYVWATPESASLKILRKRLKDDFGFPRSETYAQAYWIEGKAMGTDRTPEAAPPAAEPAPASAGTWRSQGAGDLLAPVKPTLKIAGALQALITIAQLVPFVLITELARRLLAGRPAGDLISLGAWALGILATTSVLASVLAWWLHRVDARFSYTLRARLVDKLARVPLGWFTSRPSGSVKQLVADDVLALHYLIVHAVLDLVAAIVAPIAVLAYLFVIEWRLALLMFVPVLIYLVTMYRLLVQSQAKTPQFRRLTDDLGAEAAAFLEGQRVVRIFGGVRSSSYRRKLDTFIEFLHAWEGPFANAKIVMDLVTRPATFVLLIAVAGTALVVSGTTPPVDLIAFFVLGTTFGTRLLALGYGLGGLSTSTQAATRLNATLNEAELVTEPARPGGEPGSAPVEFRAVGFEYRPGVPVLTDISLTLPAGSLTALVGPSGSGKTTLASLLARFYDVTSGQILLGGDDLRTLSPDELYSRIAFVFQNPQLVAGTIHDNIALAKSDATRAEVEAAARAAFLHERIMREPAGYDTIIAPGRLSGGETQRLTIARALLADPQVLILDEATAFADPDSEYHVQQALSRLMAGRTVLVIAHRLHTIIGADQIVVLDAGRIIERGTHTDLISAGGRYADMCAASQKEVV